MSKYSKQAILLALTLVMVLTGVGVNVIEYCCSGCKADFSLLPQKHDCCSTLQIKNNEFSVDEEQYDITTIQNDLENIDRFDTCSGLSSLGCCTITRIFFDIDYVYTKQLLEKPLIFKLDFSCFTEYIARSISKFKRVNSYLNDYYWKEPRNYLSLISVLII